MSGISAWIMSILGVVIIGTLLDLVLPNGRMSKFIKSVFATMTVLIIVLPIPNVIKNGFSFDGVLLPNAQVELDESYLQYADNLKLDYLANGVEEMLKTEGYIGVQIEIEGSFLGSEPDIKIVRINLQKLSIDTEIKNINKYEVIQKLVCEYLSVEKGLVIFYE